jgi:hypothetical protein
MPKSEAGPSSDEMTDALRRLCDLARLVGGDDADRLTATIEAFLHERS